ncbi:MAG: hypothetical protein AAF686_06065 [Pseudomonadota bacterium]
MQVPTLPVSDEELARTAHHDRGQKLVRRDAWEDLSQAIRKSDAAQRTTPGGEPAALLLAEGARNDVVAAAEDALYDRVIPDPDAMRAFSGNLRDMPDDYPSAVIIALAHLEIAAVWQTCHELHDPNVVSGHIAYHLSEATDILTPLEPTASDAPSFRAALARWAVATRQPAARLCEHYEALIALEPAAHRHFRAFGRHLLMLPDGGPAAIEVSARRMAVQAENDWGAGGYAWVYLDALALDAATLNLIDPGLFIEGLNDILARTTDQHVINVLAAFCAITMRPRKDLPALPHATDARAQIHECIDPILRHHLSELHPLIWSQALLAPGLTRRLPARRALISKGRQTALRVIAARLARDIAAHGAITLSPSGLQHSSSPER